MNFNDGTIAIGLQTHDGMTRIFEFEDVNQARGLTLDQIIFIKNVSVADAVEWYKCYMPCMMNSKVPMEHRITQLH